MCTSTSQPCKPSHSTSRAIHDAKQVFSQLRLKRTPSHCINSLLRNRLTAFSSGQLIMTLLHYPANAQVQPDRCSRAGCCCGSIRVQITCSGLHFKANVLVVRLHCVLWQTPGCREWLPPAECWAMQSESPLSYPWTQLYPSSSLFLKEMYIHYWPSYTLKAR